MYSSRRQDVHQTANAGSDAEKQAAAGRTLGGAPAGSGTAAGLATEHAALPPRKDGCWDAGSAPAFLTAPCCEWERPVSLRGTGVAMHSGGMLAVRSLTPLRGEEGTSFRTWLEQLGAANPELMAVPYYLPVRQN